MSIKQSYQGLAIAFVLLVIFPAILAVTFFLYTFLLSILPFQLPPEAQIYLGLFIIVVVFIKPVQFLMKLVNTRFEDEPDDSPPDAQRLPGAESNGSAPGALGTSLDEPLTLRQKLEILPAHSAYQILAYALLLLIIVPVIGTLTGSFLFSSNSYSRRRCRGLSPLAFTWR